MRRDSTAAKTCLRLSGLQDFKGVFAALTVMGRQFSHTKSLKNGVSMPGSELPNSFGCIKIKGRQDKAAGVNKLKINGITKNRKKKKKAEAETFSSASCCVETYCTVLLDLLGFDLRFREIRTMDDVY